MPRYARGIGYCRVSTERQAAEDRSSLADQEKAIRLLAERFGVSVVEWFRDPGASGATAEKRPAFMAMLHYCEGHPITRGPLGVVLVLNDSRWGRFPDPDEAAYWRVVLRRVGWEVRFAEGDETEDVSFRKIMRSIGDVQATKYRDALRQNARRGKMSSGDAGFWTCEAPLGYRRRVVSAGRERVLDIGVRKATDERVKLTPGPEEEVQLIRWMFESYGSGSLTLGGLMIGLAERWPSRPWTRGTVSAILKNPVYVGDVQGGRRRAHPFVTGQFERTAQSEWRGMRDAHPALITRALFASVQQRLHENTTIYRRAARGQYPLAWLVRCSACGHVFIGGGGMAASRDPGRTWRFYKCRGGHIRGSACYGRWTTIARHILEPAVIDAVAREVRRPSVRTAIEAAIDEALGAVGARGGHQRRTAEKARADGERKLENLVQAIAAGTLTEREANRTMLRARAQVADAEQLLQALRFESRQVDTLKGEREHLLQIADDFPGLAKRLTGAALRDLLRPWIADAVFHRNERSLTMHIRRVPDPNALQVSHGDPRVRH